MLPITQTIKQKCSLKILYNVGINFESFTLLMFFSNPVTSHLLTQHIEWSHFFCLGNIVNQFHLFYLFSTLHIEKAGTPSNHILKIIFFLLISLPIFGLIILHHFRNDMAAATYEWCHYWLLLSQITISRLLPEHAFSNEPSFTIF